jgi:hypothetical protein
MSEQRYVWYPDASINQWAKVPWAKEKDTEFALHEPARDSRSQEFDWGVAWRDDLRKGWHVVPMGARYVGVSGAVEGQNCAPFGCGFNAVRAAARLNAGIESASLMAWHVPEWSKLDDSVGSVLDLHDLGDRRQPCTSTLTSTTFTPDPAPRFVVKPAASMSEGEPCSASGIPQGWTLEQAEDRVRGWCADLNGGLKKADTFLCWHEWEPKPAGYTPLWGLVDTHSPEWKAFQAKRTSPYLSRGDDHAQEDAIAADLHRRSKGAARTPEPSKPSDAEIVEAWDWALRGLEAVGDWAEIAKVKQTGLSWCSSSSGGSATWAEYQAARSRELHRRVTASSEATKEAERRRVMGPIDDIDL